MLLLNRQDILRIYSMADAIRDVRTAFVEHSARRTNSPLRTCINFDSDRTLLTMPSYASAISAAAVKTICLYPHNAKNGLPTAPAFIILIDAETGIGKSLLDGDMVTKMRTGASSGVAFSLLANPGSKVGMVIGTGGQAFTQVTAMITAVPTLRKLYLVNPDAKTAISFCKAVQKDKHFSALKWEGELQARANAEEVAGECDVITLVTSSSSPVLTADNLKPGVTISCVGSYQPHMQECHSDIMSRAAAVYCDEVEAAMAESGDLIIPIAEGKLKSQKIVGEIGALAAGQIPGRKTPTDIIVYETVGIGAQDLFCAQSITQRAIATKIGTQWS